MQYGKDVRVEYGPSLKEGIATTELLHDANTEKHYQVGMRDARGKVIRLGEPMTYLDYKNKWGWYFFRKDPKSGVWREKGCADSREDAVLLAGEAGGGGICLWLTALWTRFSQMWR